MGLIIVIVQIHRGSHDYFHFIQIILVGSYCLSVLLFERAAAFS